jgi:hypothetical protein
MTDAIEAAELMELLRASVAGLDTFTQTQVNSGR